MQITMEQDARARICMCWMRWYRFVWIISFLGAGTGVMLLTFYLIDGFPGLTAPGPAHLGFGMALMAYGSWGFFSGLRLEALNRREARWLTTGEWSNY